MSRINIVPADVVVNLVTSFTIQINNVVLFNSASLIIFLYNNDSDNSIGRREINISGQDYLDWNNNDQYIINLVAKKLGFTLLNLPTDPVPTDSIQIIPTPTIPIPEPSS